MTKPLQGKIALVTGGARGIGAAISTRLAADGAKVILTYSKSATEAEKLAQKIGGKAYLADASKPETMKAFADAFIKEFGRVDVLVNNAGVADFGLIGDIPHDHYRRIFDVNVESVFALTNALVPHLQSGARIINISSILGERAIGPGLNVYNASKFAVTGFTRSWAKDLGAKGILVNAVCPGPIDTDMNPANGEGSAQQIAQTALGRYGKPDEIAAAVAFFAGPDSTYVTGATLLVDGGTNA
ncbi:MAG: SDR family oxidoreductase [Alphaproteobacteria bacterium]|nr:SDR family oxidoreductase [Alphaproteobacteria bacterium]